MKALRILYTLVVLFIFGSTTAQNKTEKPHTSIETLLNSKNFEFIANTALPLGQPPKNLVGKQLECGNTLSKSIWIIWTRLTPFIDQIFGSLL